MQRLKYCALFDSAPNLAPRDISADVNVMGDSGVGAADVAVSGLVVVYFRMGATRVVTSWHRQ